MPKIPTVRISVDTGGTFTDCIVMDGSGVRVFKVFSTLDDPARAIVTGVRQLLRTADQGAGTAPANGSGTAARGRAGLAKALEVIHGTTVGTNTLLERKGAKVALVTTAG